MLFTTCCSASPHPTTCLQLSHIVGQLNTCRVENNSSNLVCLKRDVDGAVCELLPRNKVQALNKTHHCSLHMLHVHCIITHSAMRGMSAWESLCMSG